MQPHHRGPIHNQMTLKRWFYLVQIESMTSAIQFINKWVLWASSFNWTRNIQLEQ